MNRPFKKINKISGELNLPGDKSISHRAVMFSSMADGNSRIENLSSSEDVISTINCFRDLGVPITIEGNNLSVKGAGQGGFKKPEIPLDAGNSGTTARLISGILSAQKFESTITGDYSLSKRPMNRITDPLRQMGADVTASEQGTLPLTIRPSGKLKPIKYKLPVPSAQVKSSILLAGLHFDSETCVIESVQTRNHTEKLLGLRTESKSDGIHIFSSKKKYPQPIDYFIPSDISTAAFFIVLALLIPDAELKINRVSLNSTRTGIIDLLLQMGGKITLQNKFVQCGEEYGDILVKGSNLQNIKIPASLIPNIIDEIPILSVAGIFSRGDFEIRNAAELRVKESDRISALCSNFKLLGLNVTEFKDGFSVEGKINNKGMKSFNSFDDHRIAMAFGILGSIIGDCEVRNFDCVKISNPGFLDQLSSISI